MAPNATNDVEEAVPTKNIGFSDGTNFSRKSSLQGEEYQMSAVSKMYDLDGDGQLDEAERALRDMDKEGKGISTDKMYKLMQEHIETQRDVFKMKKAIIGLVVFTCILALSNLGTSFAAAFLAKDTTTSNNALVDANTGKVLGTQNTNTEFEASTPEGEEDARTLQSCTEGNGQNSGTTTCTTTNHVAIPTQMALDMIAACHNGNNVVLARTFSGGRGLNKAVCPTTELAYTGCSSSTERVKGQEVQVWSCSDGATADITVAAGKIKIEPNGLGDYQISGDGVKSDANQACDYTYGDGDCDTNLSCTGSAGEEVCTANYGGFGGGATTGGAASTTVAPASGQTTTVDPKVSASVGSMGDACTDAAGCDTGACTFGYCTCNTSTDQGCSGDDPACIDGFAGPFCTACSTNDHCASGYICSSECGVADGPKSCTTQATLDEGCVAMSGTGYICNVSSGLCEASGSGDK